MEARITATGYGLPEPGDILLGLDGEFYSVTATDEVEWTPSTGEMGMWATVEVVPDEAVVKSKVVVFPAHLSLLSRDD